MDNLPDIKQFATNPELPNIEQYLVTPETKAPSKETSAPGRFMSAARGLTYGLTAGAARPLASYAMLGLDKLIGEGRLTRQEALEILKQQQQEDIATNPISYGAGQVAGSFGLGSRLAALKGGTTIPGAIAYGAGTGAVSGYSESERALDAVTGSVLGAATQGLGSAIAGGVQTAAQAFGKNWTKNAVRDITKQADKDVAEKVKEAVLLTGRRPSETELARMRLDRKLELADQYTIGNIMKLTGQRFVEEVKTGVPAAIGGGAAGALGALAGGADPLTGALYGAGGALAVTKANVLGDVATGASRAAGKYFATDPTGAYPTSQRMQSFAQMAERGVGGVSQSFAQPFIQNEIEKRSRLQMLADEFRAKYGQQ